MGFLRKQFEKAKRGVKDELRHRSAVRKAEKESYRESQIREAKKFGAKKAAYESSQKLRSVKQKPKGFEFKGFAGPTQKQPSQSLNLSDALIGRPSKKKRHGFDDMRLF